MKTLATIFLLAVCTLSIDRPYNHWKIVFVNADRSEPGIRQSIFIDTVEIQTALEQFEKEYPNKEIRCIARDYWETCNER